MRLKIAKSSDQLLRLISCRVSPPIPQFHQFLVWPLDATYAVTSQWMLRPIC